MSRRYPFFTFASLFVLAVAATHCAASDATTHHGTGGSGGYGASGGSGGGSGSGGTAGADAGGSAGTDGGTEASAGSGGSAGTDGGTDGSAGSGGSAGTDGGTDGSAGSDGSADSGSDAAAAYTHTITIDGTNDFSATADKFTTTTSSYNAYISWDSSALYVAYDGADIGTSAAATKWVLVYLDVDPGAGTGATSGETYNTETPAFPSGFGAEYYYGWKTDDSYEQYKSYSSSTWSTVSSSGVTHSKNSNFVEFRIPFSAMGGQPAKVGVVTLMMNEVNSAESTYAGLYNGSFTDGYYSSVPITYYLQADFASSLDPNDIANRKP